MKGRTTWVPAALVTVTALIAVSGCAPAQEPASPNAGTTAPGGSAAEPVRPAQRASSQVLPEPPRTLRLPGGTTVRVRAVGTRPDGRLAVPRDVRTAGWWRGGSRVGDPFGAVLVAGHVDSRTQGLGAYAELLTVRRGEEVVVGTATLRQTVPDPLPAPRAAVDRWRPGRRCTRRADPSDWSWSPARRRTTWRAAGYQHLAVVTAYPVGRPTRGARDVGPEATAAADAAVTPGHSPPGW